MNESNAPLPLWLEIREAIAIARVSKATFYRMIQRGAMPRPYAAGPQRRLWKASELLAAMEALPRAGGAR